MNTKVQITTIYQRQKYIRDAKWFIYIRMPLYPSISIILCFQRKNGFYISWLLRSCAHVLKKYFWGLFLYLLLA